jgi:uncharacterized membrane protein SpoIIM required for sporulation
MKLDRFLSERRRAWDELEHSLAGAKGRPEKLGPTGVLRLGDLYRSAAADLALARRRWPGDPVVRRLETLVDQARQAVYDSSGRRGSLVSFFGRTYWNLVWERPVPLLIAATMLFLPFVGGLVWALSDPVAAGGMVPGGGTIDPSGGDLGLPVAEQASLAAQIFTNNIQVTFLGFAGGILLGLGTAAVLLFNGLVLGAVGGLAIEGGSGSPFFELVVAHGVLELSCIVVASAAGLRMGWALIEPGRARRSEALRVEAQRAAQIILGTMPWLVVAGVVEGFVTPAGYGIVANTIVGFALGILFWTLLARLGRRPRTVPDASLSDTRPRKLR